MIPFYTKNNHVKNNSHKSKKYPHNTLFTLKNNLYKKSSFL